MPEIEIFTGPNCSYCRAAKDLLAQKGLYARLHTLNFVSFDDLPEEVAAELSSAPSRT